MNRLTHLLLTGTIVPVLALTPLIPASAQTPDPKNERHAPRGEGGGNRQQPAGEHAREGEHHQGAGGRQDAQGGAPRPKAETGAPRGNDQGEPRRAARDDKRPKAQPDNTVRGNDQGEPRRAARDDKRPKAQPDNTVRGNDQGQPRRAAKDDKRPKAQPDNTVRGNDQGQPRRVGKDDKRPKAQPENAQRPDDQGQPRRVGKDDNRPDALPRAAVRANDPGLPRRVGADDNRNRKIGPTGIAVGVGAGLAGGFLAATGARRMDDLRRDRREVHDGDRTFIREPGRTIIEQGGQAFIVHDENDRFRALGLNVHRERRGNEFVDTIDRPGGDQILTFTDITGRLLRRVRRTQDGREIVLIDNGVAGHIERYADDVVILPPPPMRIPRDRYIVDYHGATEGVLYDTLIAPPLAPPPRRYTLDQIRYSPNVRSYVRAIDINTITFDTGAWDVPAAATGQLEALGTAIKRAVGRDPNSVFLVEGYTDATGNPDDNLSLSDRRAQSVAEILSKDFGVPPENLTTQGYGQQNLRENTQGPSAVNRRVVVQNITQLLAGGGQPPTGQ